MLKHKRGLSYTHGIWHGFTRQDRKFHDGVIPNLVSYWRQAACSKTEVLYDLKNSFYWYNIAYIFISEIHSVYWQVRKVVYNKYISQCMWREIQQATSKIKLFSARLALRRHYSGQTRDRLCHQQHWYWPCPVPILRPSFQMWDFHVKDKTVVRPSYLYHGGSLCG